jgi:hypothetical protein
MTVLHGDVLHSLKSFFICPVRPSIFEGFIDYSVFAILAHQSCLGQSFEEDNTSSK